MMTSKGFLSSLVLVVSLTANPTLASAGADCIGAPNITRDVYTTFRYINQCNFSIEFELRVQGPKGEDEIRRLTAAKCGGSAFWQYFNTWKIAGVHYTYRENEGRCGVPLKGKPDREPDAPLGKGDASSGVSSPKSASGRPSADLEELTRQSSTAAGAANNAPNESVDARFDRAKIRATERWADEEEEAREREQLARMEAEVAQRQAYEREEARQAAERQQAGSSPNESCATEDDIRRVMSTFHEMNASDAREFIQRRDGCE